MAPDVQVIAIRQSSKAFSPKDAFAGNQDPATRRKAGDIRTMARAIVHAANMGATVINISEVSCMTATDMIDQRDLGAAIHYAAVDRNVVIVAAAGNVGNEGGNDCKQNPIYNPLTPNDPRDWAGVTTVATPAWFSDYVLTVGAVDSTGAPLDSSMAGPWVSIAAPGTDIESLSPRDDGLMNAVEGNKNTLVAPAGTSFSAAIVSGVAALVRAKYPQLTAHQVINRLLATARAPARGVDNQVGHGIVDPVAALTYDLPPGEPVGPQRLVGAAGARTAEGGPRHDPGVGGRCRCGRAGAAVFGGAGLGSIDAPTGGAVMKSTFPLSVAAGWARVVAVFVVDVGLVAAGAAVAGRPGWWTGVGVGLLVALLALLCWRGAPLLTLAWRALAARRLRAGRAGRRAGRL